MGGSFKYRGALNAIIARQSEVNVCFSSGNHAIAIAIASRALNTRAVCIVPKDISEKKRDLLTALDANVIYLNDFRERKIEFAEKLCEELKGTLIPPAGDMQVILGQSTAVFEAISQFRNATGSLPSRMFVPTGGGGLLAGAVIAAARFQASIETIPTRPEGWCNRSSLHTTPVQQTSCDALRVSQPSSIARNIYRDQITHWIPVNECEIDEAEAELWRRAKIRVERSAATGISAWRKQPTRGGGDIVFVTGGNY